MGYLMTRNEKITRMAMISAFLVHAEKYDPDMMFGSHNVSDVINSFCVLEGIDPERLRLSMLQVKGTPGDDRHD